MLKSFKATFLTGSNYICNKLKPNNIKFGFMEKEI